MQKLFEIQKIILDIFQESPLYWRQVFDTFTLNNRITGIVGNRGVGKTTFLLHTAQSQGALEGKALYVSADNIYFLQNDLLDLIDQLVKETRVRLICIDEIHKYPNWQQVLKNIADTYLDFKVLFTGSSMIDIVHGKIDLSRRVTLHTLNGLSFREYLEFSQGIQCQKIPSLEELLTNHAEFSNALSMPDILIHFKNYLAVGYYPFYRDLETDYEKFQATNNTVQKTIYEDIAILHSLKTNSLITIEQLYKYIISITPGELNINKLANALGKDFNSVQTYLMLLQQAGLVRFLNPKPSGKGALKNPVKIYADNSNLIYAGLVTSQHENSLGTVRETFVMNQVQNLGLSIFYSPVGDFQMDNNLILEIGGRNKTTRQIKNEENAYVLADGILVGHKNTIPLFLLGFLA